MIENANERENSQIAKELNSDEVFRCINLFFRNSAQLSAIEREWNTVLKSQGASILISGVAESGTTHLAEEFLNKSAKGRSLILRGRCSEGIQIPFSPFKNAFENYLETLDSLTESQKQQRMEMILHSLGEFAPLVNRLTSFGAPGADSIQSLSELERPQEALYYGTAQFLLNLSLKAAPMVLFFDDLQWIDEGSLNIFSWLAKNLTHYPILILGCYHSDESQPNSMSETLKEVFHTHLETPLLTEPDIKIVLEDLIKKELPQKSKWIPIIATRALKFSKGSALATCDYLNFFLNSSAVRARMDSFNPLDSELELPENLEQLFTIKINQIGPEAQKILRTASVLGTRFSLALLFEIETKANFINSYNRESFSLFHQSLQTAVDVNLIEVHEDYLLFVNEKARLYFLSTLREDEISQIYFQIAQVIQHHPEQIESYFLGAKSNLVAYYLAYYWTHGQPEASNDRINKTCHEAGVQAFNELSFEIADYYLRQTLDQPDPSIQSASLTYLGEACLHLGKTREAISFLSDALKLEINVNSSQNERTRIKKLISRAISQTSFSIPIKKNQNHGKTQSSEPIGPVQTAKKETANFLELFTLGQLTLAQQLGIKILAQSGIWLPITELLQIHNILALSFLLRGYAQEIQSLFESPHPKLLDFKILTKDQEGTLPWALKNWSLCALAMQGKLLQTHALIKEVESFIENLSSPTQFEPVHPGSTPSSSGTPISTSEDTSIPIFQALYLASKMALHLEQNQNLSLVNQTATAFKNLNISAKDSSPLIFPYLILHAHARLQLFLGTESNDPNPNFLPLQEAWNELRQFATGHWHHHPLLTPHLLLIEAVIKNKEGDLAKAWKLLNQAEKTACESNNPWAFFEISLQKGRFYIQSDQREAALLITHLALPLAHQLGWVGKIQKACQEFEISAWTPHLTQNSPAVKMPEAPPAVSSTSLPPHGTQQYINALIHLHSERKLLEQDLELAAMVQALLLPRTSDISTECYTMVSYYQTATQSGGDWWWFDLQANGGLSIIMTDVTGHGAGSAMVTAAIASSYKTLISVQQDSTQPDFDWLIPRLNQQLFTFCSGQYEMTLGAIQLLNDGTLQCWWGGAPPLMMMDPHGEVQTRFMPSTFLGGEQIQLAKEQIKIKKGSRIFLFTDGTYEFRTPDRPRFGLKNLKNLLSSTFGLSTAEAKDTLIAQLNAIRGPIKPADDLTFILIDFN